MLSQLNLFQIFDHCFQSRLTNATTGFVRYQNPIVTFSFYPAIAKTRVREQHDLYNLVHNLFRSFDHCFQSRTHGYDKICKISILQCTAPCRWITPSRRAQVTVLGVRWAAPPPRRQECFPGRAPETDQPVACGECQNGTRWEAAEAFPAAWNPHAAQVLLRTRRRGALKVLGPLL